MFHRRIARNGNKPSGRDVVAIMHPSQITFWRSDDVEGSIPSDRRSFWLFFGGNLTSALVPHLPQQS